MENEQNMFKWDVLRHLRDFAETFKEELEQYRALGTPTKIYEKIGGLDVELGKYHSLGTVEELRAKNEKLQGYRNQMSIYAEQHKIILASDVLDMLEELE